MVSVAEMVHYVAVSQFILISLSTFNIDEKLIEKRLKKQKELFQLLYLEDQLIYFI